ncbi:MAG: hypothetical protein JWO12_159 [Frankiales bacterium]|nr:hypothetical protein [Frankiales bacterium]
MSFTVQVADGDGVVARYGGSIVVAPSDSAIVDAVLDLARNADRDHADEPGRFLPRKVAGIVAQTDDTPTLAVVSTLSDGIAVLLVGDVSLTLIDDNGTSSVSGRDATTWVDRIVRGSWSSLTVTLAGAGAINRRSDLQGGVLTASGVQLTSAVPAVSAPEPGEPLVDPERVEVPGFESFSLAEPVAADPLPVAGETSRTTRGSAETALPEAEQQAADGAVTVQGIECSRQHFNDPTAVYCAVCGISMVHQTHNLVSGPRPPLGVLVLDDGSVYSLAGDFVLGREPDNAPEVLSGAAAPLTLDDPDVTMSRVHARIQLVDWDVRLLDAGSANGTYTAQPGETEWTKLGSGEMVVLTPGTKVSLGGRTFVFDSHHKL